MNDLESLQQRIANVSEYLDKLQSAVDGAQGSPDAPEIIAAKLGEKMEKKMDPLTPLAKTMSDADLEASTHILTRQKKLQDLIEDRIKKLMEQE